MTLKRSALLLLCLFSATWSHAQLMGEETGITTENFYKRYITAGVGAIYQSFYDDAISKYNYEKVGVAPSIGHIKINDVTYSEFYLQGSYQRFNRGKKTTQALSVTSFRALMDYRFLVKPPVNMRVWDIRGGAILSTMYGQKRAGHLLSASNINEYAISFGLSLRVAKEVYYKKKPGVISWDFSIPFISHFSRPAYLNRQELYDNENKWWQDMLDQGITESFAGYLRLNSRLSYAYQLDNGNAVKVSYIWDYTRMKHHEVAYFAEHTLMFSFLLNH